MRLYLTPLFLSICFAIQAQKQDSVLIKLIDSSTQNGNFYKKYVNATNGIKILSSHKVSDRALIRAKYIIEHMASGLPPEVVKTMINHNFRVVVKAVSEKSTDVPEHSDLYKFDSKGNWNAIRGIGATPERPVCSCSEENLLCYSTDVYKGQDVLAHEFAHGIHMMGMRFYDKGFDKELKRIWKLAKKENLWVDTFSMYNIEEYFAYGTQTWFHVNLESPMPNGVHNHVDTREELLVYDPRLYKLLEKMFPVGLLEISCNCKKKT